MKEITLVFYATVFDQVEEQGCDERSPERLLLELEEALATGELEPHEVRQILRDHYRKGR